MLIGEHVPKKEQKESLIAVLSAIFDHNVFKGGNQVLDNVTMAKQRSIHVSARQLVSEPDPRKIEKEGLAHRLGWKCTLRNVRNFINCRTLQSLQSFLLNQTPVQTFYLSRLPFTTY